MGFEVAAARLGARTTTVLATKQSKEMWAAETWQDALRSVGGWCDVVCLRHGDLDAPAFAATALPGTVIVNCGNGSAEHPTQALIDAFALTEHLGTLDGRTITMVGDLDAMRSAHSLARLLAGFADVTIHCACPEGLELPERWAGGLAIRRVDGLDLRGADAIYVAGMPAVTRVGTLSQEQQAVFRITAARLADVPDTVPVLCPLPRVDEIATDVDALPQAAYFVASRDALWMRMAILDEALGG